jgi:hypothetical protein
VQITTHLEKSEVRRRMEVIPPVSLHFGSDVALLAPGSSHPVEVELVASRPDLTGALRLEAPPGWEVSPSRQSFHLGAIGARLVLKFSITAPPESATAKIIADAEIGEAHYRNQRVEIDYPHIPPQLLQPLASLKAISLELATRGHTVGYLPGAGDSLAENLKQMGYEVKMLDHANLTPEQLQALDAIVIGNRAVQPAGRVESNQAFSVRTAFVGRTGHGRTGTAHLSRTGPPGAEQPKQNHRCRFWRLGAGAGNIFSGSMGRPLHADYRIQ